jgi:fused signal recognition particle receptor
MGTSLFDRFKRGLQRTTAALSQSVESAFTGVEVWGDAQYEALEAALIKADIGVDLATHLTADIRDRYGRGQIRTAAEILKVAGDDVRRILTESQRSAVVPFDPDRPAVILLVGVNGSGKTTTSGKLAHLWKQDGKRVILAACDTFRAAAVEQVKIWGERVDCQVVAGQHGADPAAVAYDAVAAAIARKADVLIIDTAGRQHTRKGLMDELAKVVRTVGKVLPDAPHEKWLVVDASTGSNAIVQAREFSRVVDLTGLVLTKLDGSAKGGIVVAIHKAFDIPIRYVGLGEGVDDLSPFDPDLFTDAIFGG